MARERRDLERLKVTFPPNIASHSTVQTFYFGAEGLLKRHDYNTEVSGGMAAAQSYKEPENDDRQKDFRIRAVMRCCFDSKY